AAAGTGGTEGAGDAQVVRALRRRAAAGCRGPRAGQPAGRRAGGRAERQPGYTYECAAARPVLSAARGTRRGAGARDTQPGARGTHGSNPRGEGYATVECFRRGLTMLCESCGQRDASIHYTQIEKNEMQTLHLCEQCAAEKGLQPGVNIGSFPLT